jgi:hypothetical protein
MYAPEVGVHGARRAPLSEATVLVRADPDTRDKLVRHAHRTARAWSLDGRPLLGISVFAVLDTPLDELLSAQWARAGHLRARLGSGEA